MNIVVKKYIDDRSFTIHLDRDVDKALLEKLSSISGVSGAYNSFRYQISLYIGEAFNRNIVLSDVLSEIIFFSNPTESVVLDCDKALLEVLAEENQ